VNEKRRIEIERIRIKMKGEKKQIKNDMEVKL
jgi:hypothetical protein